MKPFKSIREGNSVEPGVSEINDVPEDPLSYVEIKPKKAKVVKEEWVMTGKKATHSSGEKTFEWAKVDDKGNRTGERHYRNAAGKVMGEETSMLEEAVSVKKEKHSWGTMMTVHHGSDTSYPLHPEHQSAIKKLRPGMKTTFKDETNSTVHAHREGDTVHLTRPRSGSTLTSIPYHHFDTSEHAKATPKKPAGEYERKVTSYLKKKYNESIDLTSIWESLKPEQPVIEEVFDAEAHKKEADRLIAKHIAAHQEMVKAHDEMRKQGKKVDFDTPYTHKLNAIKREIAQHSLKIPREEPKPGSAAHYYAGKKPGEYTGD